MNPTYRILQAGEIIRQGDEVDASTGWNDAPIWKPTKCIGEPVPSQEYLAHRSYRRLMENAKMTITETIRLGAFIELLKKESKTNPIRYDFGYFIPRGIGSYRGYYDHLALGFWGEGEITVGEVLKLCQEALGKRFEGYKGGTYLMDNDTPLWVANYSHCHDTGILGIISEDGQVIIQTGYCLY